MSDYFSILPLSKPVDREGVRRLTLQACLDLYRVEWLGSCLAADGCRMLCWYRSPDAESVRYVLRQQGAREGGVWPAAPDQTGFKPLEAGREGIAVEFEFGNPGAETSTARTVSAALDAHGLTVARAFAARYGERFMAVVDTSDESSVNAGLQSAGLQPARMWRCIEVDPKPPTLFRTSTGMPVQPAQPPHIESAWATAATDAVDAVIVGAGLSGICMLERLVRMGMRARVYESGSDVGGVWFWNRYPGARVDSESYTYGFSFSEEVGRQWAWRELFAAQPEIAGYVHHVVERFDLRRHMRFSTRVTSARYDQTARSWHVRTDTGEHVTAKYLIAATGSLSTPQMPDYPGLDSFAGESYHTARWPAGGVDLAGKRVGVIGTGATGVQVIQTIAGQVDQLTVFQRTPTYCIPQRNRLLTDEDRQSIRRDWAEILASCRKSYGGFIHTFDPRPGLTISTEAREAKFEELWQKPGFAFWFGNFADLMMNDEVNAHASAFVRRKIRERVRDPEVARRLLPSHPFGAKRVPLENGYYEVYNRENVRLVDLRETPIERITKAGIHISREEHALDVIVYATGFDAGTGALTRIDIRGEGEITIAHKWGQGPKTYLGLLVHGFPNFFIVNGPHNAAALCNAGRCIEQNVSWIARCIEYLRVQGITRIAPTVEAEEEWTGHVYDVADASILSRMTESWFFGANTPGKARRATIYAAGAGEYRKHCEAVADEGYPGLTMS